MAEEISIPPIWYTKNEMVSFLMANKYSREIAEELSMLFMFHLQAAFNKGFDKRSPEISVLQRANQNLTERLRVATEEVDKLKETIKALNAMYKDRITPPVYNKEEIDSKGVTHLFDVVIGGPGDYNGYEIDKEYLPINVAKVVPITIGFDNSKIIGEAKPSFTEDGLLKADIKFNGAYKPEMLKLYPSMAINIISVQGIKISAFRLLSVSLVSKSNTDHIKPLEHYLNNPEE